MRAHTYAREARAQVHMAAGQKDVAARNQDYRTIVKGTHARAHPEGYTRARTPAHSNSHARAHTRAHTRTLITGTHFTSEPTGCLGSDVTFWFGDMNYRYRTPKNKNKR
jgi:hypothetical protein